MTIVIPTCTHANFSENQLAPPFSHRNRSHKLFSRSGAPQCHHLFHDNFLAASLSVFLSLSFWFCLCDFSTRIFRRENFNANFLFGFYYTENCSCKFVHRHLHNKILRFVLVFARTNLRTQIFSDKFHHAKFPNKYLCFSALICSSKIPNCNYFQA